MIVCRIAVSEISAHGRLAAHEWIGDEFRCVDEYGKFLADDFGGFDFVRASAPIFSWPSLSEM
jgi:hypothetical protein